MRIAMAGVTGNMGGATHTPLRPTRRERRTGFSLGERARLAKRELISERGRGDDLGRGRPPARQAFRQWPAR
jgi:hypothetical protein